MEVTSWYRTRVNTGGYVARDVEEIGRDRSSLSMALIFKKWGGGREQAGRRWQGCSGAEGDTVAGLGTGSIPGNKGRQVAPGPGMSPPDPQDRCEREGVPPRDEKR